MPTERSGHPVAVVDLPYSAIHYYRGVLKMPTSEGVKYWRDLVRSGFSYDGADAAVYHSSNRNLYWHLDQPKDEARVTTMREAA